MTARWWEGDEPLVAALGDALAADLEVPASFGAVGKAVYAPPDLDAELAELTFDSADQPLALARSDDPEEPATLRALTYAGARLTVHLEVGASAVHGQVSPPQECEVRLQEQCGGQIVVRADGDGWFTVRPVPLDHFRLHCRGARDGAVVTGWIAL